MKEKHIRSIIKSISWRALATITTIIIVFIFTRSLTIALGIGLVEVIAKIILYYGHERFWDKVMWGRK